MAKNNEAEALLLLLNPFQLLTLAELVDLGALPTLPVTNDVGAKYPPRTHQLTPHRPRTSPQNVQQNSDKMTGGV